MNKNNSERGAYLVEFTIIIPVIFLLIYGALELNTKSESLIFIQQANSNLRGKMDEVPTVDSKEAKNTGFRYAHFSNTLKNYQESLNSNQPLDYYKILPEKAERLEKKDPQIGSDTYKNLIKLQYTVADYIFEGALVTLAKGGIVFDSREEMRQEIYEFIEKENENLYSEQFLSTSNIVSKSETTIVPTQYVERNTYLKETGYHPDKSHDKITIPGIAFGQFDRNATHWGVSASDFYRGSSRKPRSSYRDESFALGLIAAFFTSSSVMLSMVDDNFLNDLYAYYPPLKKEQKIKEYKSMSPEEKKQFIENIRSTSNFKPSKPGELGFLGRRLLAATSLKRGFTLNCPYNFRVSSNCITNSEYGTILPIAAMIVVIVKTIFGGAKTGVEDILNKGFDKIVQDALKGVEGRVIDTIKKSAKDQIDRMKNDMQQKIIDAVEAEVEKIIQEVENSDVLGQKL